MADLVIDRFPIHSDGRAGAPTRPGALSKASLEPLRRQIEINHGQTIEGLAERGGLTWSEILWAIRGGVLPFPSESEDACAELVIAHLMRGL